MHRFAGITHDTSAFWQHDACVVGSDGTVCHNEDTEWTLGDVFCGDIQAVMQSQKSQNSPNNGIWVHV